MNIFKNISLASPVELKKLIDYRHERIISLSIHSSDHLDFVIYAMDRHEIISEETTPGSEYISILEGELRVQIEEKTFLLAEGQSIIIPPLQSHSLEALTPCKMVQLSVN